MASSNGNGNGNGGPTYHDALHLTAQTDLLESILAELRTELMEVGVSDAAGRELILEQHPVAGCKRVLAYRTGNGTDGLVVPTAPGVMVFPANEARIGLTLINSGANAIILYLSDQKRPGVPCVFLNAAGGSWDGRFGAMPWAGNVFAVAQVGASTLVGGEI